MPTTPDPNETAEPTELDRTPQRLPVVLRAEMVLIVGSSLLLDAVLSKRGRAVLVLAAALTGCVTWGLLAR